MSFTRPPQEDQYRQNAPLSKPFDLIRNVFRW